MLRSLLWFSCGLVLWLTCQFASVVASDAYPADYQADDPFASIDDQPIFVGELKIVLKRLAPDQSVDDQSVDDQSVDDLSIDVHRAAAVVLVRRHLAMKSLQQQGGQAVQDAIKRFIDRQNQQLSRKGMTAEDLAASMDSDAKSLRASWSWQAAWQLYLKSRLTDANLKIFYEKSRQATDPEFEDLTDLRDLRRQATDRLFANLVNSAGDRGVRWLIPALEPGASSRSPTQ